MVHAGAVRRDDTDALISVGTASESLLRTPAARRNKVLQGTLLLTFGLLAASAVWFGTRGADQSPAVGYRGVRLFIEDRRDPCDRGHNCKMTNMLTQLASTKEPCAKLKDDCTRSKCCITDGMQCYEKNDHWAECKESCTPGPDMTDFNAHNWTCSELGARTPGKVPELDVTVGRWVRESCSEPGTDCRKSKCCAWKGMQCFVKDDDWATCKAECYPGPDPGDDVDTPWNCTALGPRTPGESTLDIGSMKPAKWVADKCSNPGEDCRHTKCCAWGGTQCYEKSDGHASCKTSCVPGPDLTDPDPGHWTCKKVGLRTPGTSKIKAGKKADWVHSKCSKPGEDCSDSQCCSWGGMRCYRKSDRWASCRYLCNHGPDPTDLNNHPWNCTPVGPRTPGKIIVNTKVKAASWVKSSCAQQGQNCSETRCCAAAGEQCYEKNWEWAMCRPSCRPGPDPTDINSRPWSCRELGFRTPGVAKEKSMNVEPAAWVSSKCAHSGQSCGGQRCCADNGQQCYEKNQYWAVCSNFCIAKKDATGEAWSCRKVGSRTPKPWGSPSLYCFAVLRSFGYEPELMEEQMARGAGIFGCDGYDVACSSPLTLGNHIKPIKFEDAAVGISVDKTAANTQLFLNVWESIKNRGSYADFDWTVKADPDCVIIPDRVRTHLRPHTGKNAYIVNCDKPQMIPMMFGSLETFTKQAIQTFFDNVQRCKDELQWNNWGEDFFMGKCMDKIGVSAVDDFKIISDGVCKQADCNDKSAAAYHPMKSKKTWVECYSQAL